MTDAVLSRVKVNNALRVIHFDLPKTKESFNARLWCMRENFKLPLLGKNVSFKFERLYWRYSFKIMRGLKLEARYLLHKKSKGAKIVKFFNLDFSCPLITLNLKLNLFLMEHHRRSEIYP